MSAESSKAGYTPGPLTVTVEDRFPFDIVTTDAKGSEVFRRRMPSHSTDQKTPEDCLAGRFMPPGWDAGSINRRALADEILRAAAPALVEALRSARDYITSELARERDTFMGYENCSDIPAIERDLAQTDAALKAAGVGS